MFAFMGGSMSWAQGPFKQLTSLEWIAFPSPLERVSAILVPLVDEAVQGRLKVLDALEAGRLEAISLEDGEPDLYLVEPRSVLGGEVELKAIAVPSVPVESLLADVRVEIVHHQMNPAAGIRVRDPIQERQEVRLLARLVAPTQDLPGAHVETRHEAGRSMSDVLGLESTSFSGRRGNDGRRSLQSLDAGLLIDRKNNLSLRDENRIHLDNVSHPLEEVLILAVHPHLESIRFQVRSVEDGPDGRGADRGHLLRIQEGVLERAQAPLRTLDSVVSRQMAGHGDDCVALLRRDSRGPARPGFLNERLQAALNKPAPPKQDLVPAAPDQPFNLSVRRTSGSKQEDAPPLDEAILSLASATLPHQLASLAARKANPVFRLWSRHGADLQLHSWSRRAKLANKSLGLFSGKVY